MTGLGIVLDQVLVEGGGAPGVERPFHAVDERGQLRGQCHAGHELQHAEGFEDLEQALVEFAQAETFSGGVVGLGAFFAGVAEVPFDGAAGDKFEVGAEFAVGVTIRL